MGLRKRLKTSFKRGNFFTQRGEKWNFQLDCLANKTIHFLTILNNERMQTIKEVELREKPIMQSVLKKQDKEASHFITLSLVSKSTGKL